MIKPEWKPAVKRVGGMFARRAPSALLFFYLPRLQPQIYPLMEKPPKKTTLDCTKEPTYRPIESLAQHG